MLCEAVADHKQTVVSQLEGGLFNLPAASTKAASMNQELAQDGTTQADTDSTACTDKEAEVDSSEEDRAEENEKAGAVVGGVVKPIEETCQVDDEAALTVLQSYGRRFAEMRQGDVRPFSRAAFPWQLCTEKKAEKEVSCSDLVASLGALHRCEGTREATPSIATSPEEAEHAPLKKLALTFGYAGNLDKNPPFARFDIRDHVCMRVGGFKHGQVVRDESGNEFIVVGVKRVEGAPRLWFQPRGLQRTAAGAFPGASAATLRSKLSPVQKVSGENTRQRLSVRLREVCLKDFESAEGSDGEEVLLCQRCHFPMGEFAYAGEGKGGMMHGECMAQSMLRNFEEKEEAHNQDEAALKQKRRLEHDIGWKVERIPDNALSAQRLGCSPAPQGMVCLVFDEKSHSVRVAPTVEPAASICLEYLSLALQVRLLEGREPRFSLDPVDPAQSGTMLFKRFEPQWLAGTSAGEVLFQADYHLKELSMDECEQPVLGMKSCFDYSEDEGHKEWNAREWFVVNKAEVQLSDDDVLIPYVRMGVQAREQILEADGHLEDCEITRTDHPLVKYAEAFTRNFDLIAERKSVIYHLRELAKATILAKFVVEADVCIDEAWLSLASDAQPTCRMEVPQLWNERCHSKIRMQDGAIVNEKQGFGSSVHGVYGGVDFGLGRFRLASTQRPAGVLTMAMSTPPHVRPHTLGVPPGFEPKKVRGTPVQRPAIFFPKPALAAAPVAARPVVAPPVTRPAAPPMRAAPPPTARAARPARPVRAARPARPAAPAAGVQAQGVDLNLDRFDLSAPVEQAHEAANSSWGTNVQSTCLTGSIGAAFWRCVGGDYSESGIFNKEDAKLLKSIFNPHQSDRQSEGNRFVPPDTSFSYLEHLRGLLKEEDSLRQKREDHFLSTKFATDDAGPLFPSAWRPGFGIARGDAPVRPASASPPQTALLQLHPEGKGSTPAVEHLLNTAVPVFDRSTEDGTRFRIYRTGDLEVRTTQRHGVKEATSAIFSTRGSTQASVRGGTPGTGAKERERVIKVTEYVERTPGEHGCSQQWRSYVVLETEQGNVIATEQLSNGTMTWEESPAALEDRNALARVIRSASRPNSSVCVQDVKDFQNKELAHHAEGVAASPSKCKRYAQGVYSRAALAVLGRAVSGFRHPAKSDKWKLGKGQKADPQDVPATRRCACTGNH